jgi:uncharacterized SAM-binding protein YcdF (DUF218 family)
VKWLRRNWLRLTAGLLFAGLVAVVSALFFSVNLLRVESPSGRADAIVVLGGDVTHRPRRALELYQQKAAPGVIISGTGDCEDVRIFLAGHGVPSAAMQLECKSRTTMENALLTATLLRTQHVRRVIVVTSWFHSRRALNCFRRCAPEIEFISLPTTADAPKSHWPNQYERSRVLLEYAKIFYYRVRHGIPLKS